MVAQQKCKFDARREENFHASTEPNLILHDGSFVDKHNQSERRFEIGMAITSDQRSTAEELINEMYGWRGYGADHHLNSGTNSFTFTASIDGRVVGTLSLTVDHENRMAADDTFEDVLNDVRSQPGIHICELTKFAFSPSAAPMDVLASLFHTIFIFGTQKFSCTDLFIEVNPRHIRFYKTLLGFTSVGDLRSNISVSAPSQLLRLRVSDIATYIAEYAGEKEKTERSLYPYFLTAAQEFLICERMAALEQRWPFINRPVEAHTAD